LPEYIFITVRMLKNLILFAVLIIMQVIDLYGQDSIVLYNGKSILGKVSDNKNQTFISYKFQKKNKVKIKYLSKENIFAIYYRDSLDDVLYVPDVSEEVPFTIDEMQRFVSGSNLARYNYHPRWATICGAATGLGGIYLGFFGMLIPTAYIAVSSAVPVKPLKKKYFPADKVNDDFYVEGFKQEAKRKKLVNSLLGGVSGFLVLGTTLGIMTSLDYKNWGK
jgi:hypothetical protein